MSDQMADLLEKDGWSVEFRSDHAWSFPRLQLHDYFEINLALGGSGVFFIEGEVCRLERGTLTFISSSLLHKNAATSPGYSRCVIKMMPELIERYCTERTDLLAPFRAERHMMKLDEDQIDELTSLARELLSIPPDEVASDVMQQISLAKILIAVNRYASEHVGENARASAALPDSYSLKLPLSAILRFINDNISSPISADVIAERFFMSRSSLYTKFRSATGMTVSDYIVHRRTLAAKQLMGTDRDLLEISHMSGFGSYTTFARCFRKTTGYSPREYRAMAFGARADDF